MEILRREVLEEMVRNGRIYGKHEVKALAQEALAWRDGKDPTAYDGVVIQVPRVQIERGYLPSTKIREMKMEETAMIRWEPSYAKYVYTVVHRMREP